MSSKIIVFDTDLLSTLLLIDRFDFITFLYPDYQYLVPNNVEKEINNPTYKHSKTIKNRFKKLVNSGVIAVCNQIMIEEEDLMNLFFQLRATGKYGKLIDSGEAEVVARAKMLNAIVASNNFKDVTQYTKKFGLDLISTSQIIYRAYKSGYISLDDGKLLFNNLIKNGEKISSYNSFDDYISFLEDEDGKSNDGQ